MKKYIYYREDHFNIIFDIEIISWIFIASVFVPTYQVAAAPFEKNLEAELS